LNQFKLIFDPNQINNAAQYLEQHNVLCKQSAEYWEESIYNTIKRYAPPADFDCVGTGGYLVNFFEEGVDTVVVEVYIDPKRS